MLKFYSLAIGMMTNKFIVVDFVDTEKDLNNFYTACAEVCNFLNVRIRMLTKVLSCAGRTRALRSRFVPLNGTHDF